MRTVGDRRWRLVRARREAVHASVRRWWRRTRPVSSRALWLTGAGLVLVGAALWVVYATSVLGVRAVEVTGVQVTSSEEVLAAAAVLDGTPLARVDTDGVSERVRALPAVASVDVRRSWPTTLIIEVTERSPAATVAVDGGFAIVDADGVVFHQVASPPAGVPILRVSAPGPEDAATLAALRVLAALTPELRAELAAISADSPNRIRLELVNDREVIWGDAEQSDRKAQVATALLAQPVTTIDVSAPEVASTK